MTDPTAPRFHFVTHGDKVRAALLTQPTTQEKSSTAKSRKATGPGKSRKGTAPGASNPQSKRKQSHKATTAPSKSRKATASASSSSSSSSLTPTPTPGKSKSKKAQSKKAVPRPANKRKRDPDTQTAVPLQDEEEEEAEMEDDEVLAAAAASAKDKGVKPKRVPRQPYLSFSTLLVQRTNEEQFYMSNFPRVHLILDFPGPLPPQPAPKAAPGGGQHGRTKTGDASMTATPTVFGSSKDSDTSVMASSSAGTMMMANGGDNGTATAAPVRRTGGSNKDKDKDIDVSCCMVCRDQRNLFLTWYAAHPDRLTIETKPLEEYATFVPQDVCDPRHHDHVIRIDDDYEIELPEFRVTAVDYEIKRRRRNTDQGNSDGEDEDKDEDGDEEPEHRHGYDSDGEYDRDRGDPVVQHRHYRASIHRWCRQALVKVRKYFVRNRPNAFVPHDYQQRFIEEFARLCDWDQEAKAMLRDKSFLLWLKQGLGKTDAVGMAIQQHPLDASKGRIIVSCNNTLISYWRRILMGYPQTVFGARTHVFVLGNDEFRNRVRSDPDFARGALLIFDECQRFRNLGEAQRVEVRAMESARFVLHVTGTPLVNQPTDDLGMRTIMGYLDFVSQAELTRNPRKYARTHRQPESAADMVKLRADYQGRVFFYEEPQHKIATERVDVRVPMTLTQSLEYILEHKSSVLIGPYKLETGKRNSWDSCSRRVGNCVMDPEDETRVLWSPKFDSMLEHVRRFAEVPNRGKLPIVIYSGYVGRGVEPLHRMLLAQPWAAKLRIVLMSRRMNAAEREAVRQRFEDGEIDVLLMTPIAETGLNLVDGAVIMLTEVQDSEGETEQIVARILRAGAALKRPDMVVSVLSFISTFHAGPATPAEKQELVRYFTMRMNPKNPETVIQDLEECEVDLADEVAQLSASIGFTADEKRADRNPEKAIRLLRIEVPMKMASIPFKDIPQRFETEWNQLVKAG